MSPNLKSAALSRCAMPALSYAASSDADSATPTCPHFGPCGGCQLQHLTYSAQLGRKAARLAGLLAAAGALPSLQLHPSPPLAYRNRIRLTLAEVNGQLRAGYLTGNERPASDGPPAFLPITQCPIAAPILWRAAEIFLAEVNHQPGQSLRSPQHALDQLELFTTSDESRLQLSLYIRPAANTAPAKLAAAFTAFCEGLGVRIPELAGAGIFLLPPQSTQRSRRAEQPRPGPSWGSPGLNYSVPTQDESVLLTLNAGKGKNPRISPLPLPVPQLTITNYQLPTVFWVPRGAFFQVNRFLLPELLALVTAGQTGVLAWDLYAGVGLFSRALAARFDQVTAVEIAEPAATALAAAKLANLRAVKATTLDFLRRAVTDRDRPDLIILDPPRSGAGREVCELLGRIAAPALVYISCSPEVLPADLATLIAAGYSVRELHLLDLFPQTTHIETVAILTRERSLQEAPTR